MKLTGIAPLIGPVTVNVVDPTPIPPTIAVTCMLFGVLLAVTPTRVTLVVVVMFMVVDPLAKVAAPVPLVVDMLRAIEAVFVEGLTVAVVDTGFPSGTNGVSPNVTVGLTLPPPPGENCLAGQIG
jgi:hypothetical protein